MKYALLFIVFTLTLIKVSFASETERWTSCIADSECTSVVGYCHGTWEPINKRHLNDFWFKTNECSNQTTCLMSNPACGYLQPVTICRKNACTLTDKTMTLTAEKWLDIQRGRLSSSLQITIIIIVFLVCILFIALNVKKWRS